MPIAGLSPAAPILVVSLVGGVYLAAYLWLFQWPMSLLATSARSSALSAMKLDRSSNASSKILEFYAFIIAIVSFIFVSAVVWNVMGGRLITSFIEALKCISLLLLAFVGIGIAADDDNRVARAINGLITVESVLIAVLIGIKLLNDGHIPMENIHKNAEDIINKYFVSSMALPIVSYSVLDFILMSQTASESRSSYALKHQRFVARRFLVYCDLPAAVTLALILSLVFLWPYQVGESTSQLLSGAMAFVVISHAICSKAVDIYNPPEPSRDVGVRRVDGHLDLLRLTRLQISMHNPSCAGPALRTLVEWLKAQGVSHIEFQIADTLHRHNLKWQSRRSESSAYAEARRLGDLWLLDNRETIRFALDSFESVRITRWDYWLQKPGFDAIEAATRSLSKQDGEFEAKLEAEAGEYFRRSGRTLTTSRMRHAMDFLIEEVAVTEYCANVELSNEVYPGTRFLPEEHLCKVRPDSLRLPQLNFVSVII